MTNEIAKTAEIEKDTALVGRIMTDAEISGCDLCGKTTPDVKRVIDPYTEQLDGEEIEMNLCDRCYVGRADDV